MPKGKPALSRSHASFTSCLRTPLLLLQVGLADFQITFYQVDAQMVRIGVKNENAAGAHLFEGQAAAASHVGGSGHLIGLGDRLRNLIRYGANFRFTQYNA
jgi:hypothetical protein